MGTNEWAESFPGHQINGATKFLFQEIDHRGKVSEIFFSFFEDNKDVIITAIVVITPTNRTKNTKPGHTEFSEMLGVVLYHLEKFSPSRHAGEFQREPRFSQDRQFIAPASQQSLPNICSISCIVEHLWTVRDMMR